MSTHDVTTVQQVLYEVIGEILPGIEDIRHDRHLRDLGADSVDRVEIIALTVQRLGSATPLSEFGTVPDIGALITKLAATTSE